MKIFISHSSKNADYGKALVEFLTSIGVAHNSITFTSDSAYGIPSGANIFDWLKGKISEKPFVIYLLSPEYFSSVACLNEMGAAWIIENQHISIFTPDFDIDGSNFRNSVLDPREMGFRLNDRDRITQFADEMKYRCNLQTNPVMINRACDKLVAAVSAIKSAGSPQTPRLPLTVSYSNQNSIKPSPQKPSPPPAQSSTVQGSANRRLTPDEKFFSDFEAGKLKDEEVLLIHYASETGRFSLGVGWRTDEERKRIAEWEELNQYSDTLSKKYESALSRLEVRNLTSVSERTSHGNPRQVDFVDGLKERMLDLPDSLHERALEIIQRDLENKDKADENPFSF